MAKKNVNISRIEKEDKFINQLRDARKKIEALKFSDLKEKESIELVESKSTFKGDQQVFHFPSIEELKHIQWELNTYKIDIKNPDRTLKEVFEFVREDRLDRSYYRIGKHYDKIKSAVDRLIKDPKDTDISELEPYEKTYQKQQDELRELWRKSSKKNDWDARNAVDEVQRDLTRSRYEVLSSIMLKKQHVFKEWNESLKKSKSLIHKFK